MYLKTHISVHRERLKSSLPDFTVQIVDRKNTFVCSDVVERSVKDGIHHVNNSSLARALLKVAVLIRTLMKDVTNAFNGTFERNCQQSSLPFPLVSLCSLLIDGVNHSPQDVSQAALIAAHIIMYSYKKQRSPSKMLQQEDSLKCHRHLKM